MKLVVEELKSTLSQTVNFNLQKRYLFKGIRPYIYMHNSPAGIFTISIKSGGDTLASETFTSAEIKTELSTSDIYAHLWKILTFSAPLQLGKGEYELELSSSGYTFSQSSYMGWIKKHDTRFDETSGTPVSDMENPYSYQFFNFKEAR